MSSPPTNSLKENENGGLMFAWGQRRSVLLYLGIFGAASLVIHLLGFYLFQVVYPASGRLEPEPSRITLLSDSEASVNALLRNVEDRLVYLRPASAGLDVRVSLGDYSAQFQPSFSERQVAFKSVPPIEAIRSRRSGQVADPLAPSSERTVKLTLPAADGAAKLVPEPSDQTEPRWRISGDLESRAAVDGDAFSKSLPALVTPPSIRFRIGVGANGAIHSYLPVAGQGHPRMNEVMEAVRQGLRFEPKPESETEWGWLEINR